MLDARRAIACLAKRSIPAAFCQVIHELAPFDDILLLIHQPHIAPVLIHDSFSSKVRERGLTQYLRSTYALDPFFRATRRGCRSGVYRSRQLAAFRARPRTIAALGAVVSPEEELGYRTRGWPRGLEEITIAVRFSNDTIGQAALYRDSAETAFTEQELNSLRFYYESLAEVFAALQQDRPRTMPALSVKENQVYQLLLAGNNSRSIAHSLGIAQSTVKSHRKNIYHKLGVCSLAELFALPR
jgi:DNA-binding CsgD family transcriptional regulator